MHASTREPYIVWSFARGGPAGVDGIRVAHRASMHAPKGEPVVRRLELEAGSARGCARHEQEVTVEVSFLDRAPLGRDTRVLLHVALTVPARLAGRRNRVVAAWDPGASVHVANVELARIAEVRP